MSRVLLSVIIGRLVRSCLLAVLFALAFAPGAFARLDGYVQGFRAVVLLPGGTAGPSYGLRAP